MASNTTGLSDNRFWERSLTRCCNQERAYLSGCMHVKESKKKQKNVAAALTSSLVPPLKADSNETLLGNKNN